jgi:hypothetical protein
MMIPVPPFGHEKSIAFSGQTNQQAPHSQQVSYVLILALPSFNWKQLPKQALIQAEQPVHSSDLTFMKSPVPGTHSQP